MTPFSYAALNPSSSAFDPAWNDYLHTASGEWLMLNSSPMTPTFADGNGAYSSDVSSVMLRMELVDITSGLSVHDPAGNPMFAGGINSTEEFGLLDSAFSFTPVFATLNTALPGMYEAKFKLIDGSGTFGESGEFRYSFQVAAIPEPSTCAFVGLSLGAILCRRSRRSGAVTPMTAA